MKTPIVIINFKTYDQASGEDALELAKICKEVAKEQGKAVAVCPQAFDAASCARQIPSYAQHFNVEAPGGHTGKLTIKSLLATKAKGSLLNHSENRISFTQIMESIAQLQENKKEAIVCVKDAKEAKKVAKLTPDAIAIEPPKLIGGDISVTSADPKIVSESVLAVHSINPNIPVLCGAGVHTTQDVKAAIKLGAAGVLVASGVTKATNKKSAVLKLVRGL
jgi:triosephosphate isomerase